MPDLPGVDVASWQGAPNQWVNTPAAVAAGWAAVKFTELQAGQTPLDDYVNPDAKADWDWLYEHQKGRIAYLYAHPASPVSGTVAAFKVQTDKLGLLASDGVAVDLETSDGMSPAEVASWARELFAELESVYGRRIILYSNVSMIQGGFCEGLENYLLWIASITTPGMPQVPAPFTDWFAQQYTLAPPGGVDQDVAHFSSLAAMQAAMGAPRFRKVVGIHVTTGEESLIGLSHLLQTEISTILRLTLNASADHLFATNLADYLDYGNFQLSMAKGITLRFYESVRT